MAKTQEKTLLQNVGMSYQYLRDLENGKYSISSDKLINICTFTKVSADYILFGTKNNIDDSHIELLKQYTIKQLEEAFNIIESVGTYFKVK